MTVGIYTVFRHDPIHYITGAKLIESVRETMPGVEIVHLTDETSPPLLDSDAVERRPSGKMLERRIEHYGKLGEWLFLDTDCLVRADCREVFDVDFDVALTERDWPNEKADALKTMRFNTGVVFSRCPEFWFDVLKDWKTAGETDWMSEQRAVQRVAGSGRFKVRVLSGMVYNRPPQTEKDPCEGAKILHYKGNRKIWLWKR